MDNYDNQANNTVETTLQLFRQRLRTIRQLKNLTLEELADKADTSANYLQLIESGRRTPTIAILMKICQAMDVTPNALLLGTDTKSYSEAVSSVIEQSLNCEQSLKQLLDSIQKIIECAN